MHWWPGPWWHQAHLLVPTYQSSTAYQGDCRRWHCGWAPPCSSMLSRHSSHRDGKYATMLISQMTLCGGMMAGGPGFLLTPPNSNSSALLLPLSLGMLLMPPYHHHHHQFIKKPHVRRMCLHNNNIRNQPVGMTCSYQTLIRMAFWHNILQLKLFSSIVTDASENAK